MAEVASQTLETAADLLAALVRCGVLEQSQVVALGPDLVRFEDLPALARELVRRGWATPYQLREVGAGRGAALLLGQYVLLEPLGEGGMGQVYRARHRRLDRVDALKLIRRDYLDSPDALARFLREARAAARLSHPNIVGVYSADECNGVHFLAMEFVPGIDLAGLVQRTGPLSTAHACDFVRQAALGLQHAHERGLVHRDVKPANLLLTDGGGVVKLLDLGLARLNTADDRQAGLTQTGIVMGSPDYMAPEQAIDSHQVDTRADVYSLGCTLYFLLAGEPPFGLGSVTQKLLWHQQKTPPPIEGRRSDLPPGLPELMHRLLAKHPGDRPQTPGEVATLVEPFADLRGPAALAAAADIRAALNREQPGGEVFDLGLGGLSLPLEQTVMTGRAPVHSTPPVGSMGGLELALTPAAAADPGPVGPPARPTPQPSTAAYVEAGAAGVVTAPESRPADAPVSGTSTGAPVRPRQQRGAGRGAGSNRKGWLVAGAGFLLALVILGGVLWSLRGKRPSPPGDDRTGELRVFHGHDGEVLCLAAAADGKRLASGSRDGTVRVWDVEGGVEAARVGQLPFAVHAVAWSPLREQVAFGGVPPRADGSVSLLQLWGLDPARGPVELNHRAPVRALAFTPDGARVLAAGGDLADPDYASYLWNLDDGARDFFADEGGQKATHAREVTGAAVTPDGRRALTCGRDRAVCLYDLHTTRLERRLTPEVPGPLTCLAVSPDGRRLATAGGAEVVVYSLETCQETARCRSPKGEVLALAFTPDGRLLSAAADGTLRLWDAGDGRELAALTGHTGRVNAVVALPDGRRAATAGEDRTVRLWRLPQ